MIDLISSDSPFVQAVVSAGKVRLDLEKAQGHVLPDAEISQCDASQVATVINAAFWASIAKEEGRSIHGALCFATPSEVQPFLEFAIPRPLTRETVIALTTAAPTLFVGVRAGSGGRPEAWGFLANPPSHLVRLRIASAGTLIAFHHAQSVAVLSDGRVTIPSSGGIHDWMRLVSLAFGKDLPVPEGYAKASRFLAIVSAMFRHGHGGTIVLVPPTNCTWRDSVSINYLVAPDERSTNLKGLLGEFERASKHATELRDRMLWGTHQNDSDTPSSLVPLRLEAEAVYRNMAMSALRSVGRLTAVDGALVIDEEFGVLGFGAKLNAPAQSFELTVIDTLDGSVREHVPTEDMGGTRHLSATRFISAHRDCMAFVASQDGRLTLFAWAIKEQTVVAFKNMHHMIWEYQ